jgi:hypothetical protein
VHAAGVQSFVPLDAQKAILRRSAFHLSPTPKHIMSAIVSFSVSTYLTSILYWLDIWHSVQQVFFSLYHCSLWTRVGFVATKRGAYSLINTSYVNIRYLQVEHGGDMKDSREGCGICYGLRTWLVYWNV